MDGAAPKAKLHPPRRARAPCAHVAEGSGVSAKYQGKEPQMFAVVSGVNAEGEQGASGLGEGLEGCIGDTGRIVRTPRGRRVRKSRAKPVVEAQ